MAAFTTRPEILGTFGVVASTHWLATASGMAILEGGGNAFDAACATGFVLQVVEPHMCGLGGDAPIILAAAGGARAQVVCGQGPAPAAATLEAYRALGIDLIPGNGLLAAVVPGAFDAWLLMLERYGTMTLADVLALEIRPGAEGIRFNIETKLTPLAPEETAGPDEFARAVVAVLRAEGMVERSNLQSFDWRVLFAARRLAPELATVCLTAEQRWHDNVHRGRGHPSPWTADLDIGAFDGSVPRMVEAAGCAVWSPYYRDLSEEALAEAHELGLTVVVWTVNEVDEMAALARLGVDGIITDYPDRAVEALAPWR